MTMIIPQSSMVSGPTVNLHLLPGAGGSHGSVQERGRSKVPLGAALCDRTVLLFRRSSADASVAVGSERSPDPLGGAAFS